ncbi:MAG: hypothetical protein IKI57_00055 [Clostridia bacterium]|nr:hypothetical protein [Clostridia bacterium]
MSDITLARSFVHNYDGPNGKELYEFDKKVIEHLRKGESRDFGYMKFVLDEIGIYPCVMIFYDDTMIFKAQEVSSGDWWVSWCSLPIDSNVWKYVFSHNSYE